MNTLKDKKYIDAKAFEALVTRGASNLKSNKEMVNDLNVFPIPDGDTGDNMYMTLGGGISQLKSGKDKTLEEKARALADGMILNARGNSGVILSQFFLGIAKGLEGVKEADSDTFLSALRCGVKEAYSAVVTPVEGTVLTVMREATEYMEEHPTKSASLLGFLKEYVEEMKLSLDRTPDLLDVLAEAGVVDSGGAGLVAIFEGMLDATGEERSTDLEESSAKAQSLDFDKFTEDSEMTYGYCTELLLRLQRAKVSDPEHFDIQTIISYLEGIGDSIAAFMTGTIVKIHVHTLTPHLVLEFCQKFGEFLTIKIENMTLQHNETPDTFATKKKEGETKKRLRARRPFALVTVGTGSGLCDTFRELGADLVIEGGQTKNPSVEDFLEAFETVNADHIFVLPNNSNIILAAATAGELYEKEHGDTHIHVIKTKSFGEAYSILSMLDYSSADAAAIIAEMESNRSASVTGMISTAIRSVNIDGIDIKEGDYIGFSDKTMLLSEHDSLSAFYTLTKKLCAEERDFMICFFGKDVTDSDMSAAEKYVKENYPSLEFYPVRGGQDVYTHIVIME